VKRGGVTALFLAACAVAGLLAAIALTAAPVGGADTGTTGTDTTATTAPPTETAPTTTTTAPRALTIATGVTVGRAPVGGLAPEAARAQLRRLFSRPLKLKLPARTIAVTPQELGAAAYVGDALKRARLVRPGANVPLSVKVNPASIERYVRALARRVDRAPVDSRLLLRKLKPYVTPGAPGRRLKQVLATRSIALALKTHDRGPVELRFDELEQKESRATIGDVIVIRRGQNRLYFYDGMHLVRAFGVATGQSRYPTPLGRYEIVVKWKNPWWYPPPDSPWAKGAKAIPPGPGNPLGTRWLGLSAPLVGIHGTPNDASIGYSQSHGCIRMHIPDAEWLFGQVDIGTPVYIVAP
jgi:lipoprotein-anchoring transpeptidase ErfK/SrfK